MKGPVKQNLGSVSLLGYVLQFLSYHEAVVCRQ